MGAAATRCVYCATTAPARTPRRAPQPHATGQLGALEPQDELHGRGQLELQDESRGRASREALDRPIATPSNPARGVAARPLSIAQQRALRRQNDSLAYPLLVLLVLVVSAAVAWSFVALRPLNPGPNVLLTFAPLAALLLCAAFGWLWAGSAHAACERLCTAIAPKATGGKARCYTCGEHLPVRGYLQRCNACGSDNVTDPRAMRRAGKTDASLNADASRPLLDELQLRFDALERARTSSRRLVLLAPLAAIAALAALFWQQQWHLPPMSPRRHVVISTPGCNMVVTAIGNLVHGFVRTDVPLRGSWKKHDELPLVYDQAFAAEQFLHHTVVFAESHERGEISSVFRRPSDPTVKLLVDVGGEQRELPLVRACIEEGDPYRDVDGLTRAQRQNQRDERKRLIMQGQLHEQPPQAKNAKTKVASATATAADDADGKAAPAAGNNPAVDPSLQMWTKPQR